eukprot:820095-Rhodomonas_salina.1
MPAEPAETVQTFGKKVQPIRQVHVADVWKWQKNSIAVAHVKRGKGLLKVNGSVPWSSSSSF